MVLCQELSAADYGAGGQPADLERKFYGLWTFEPALVQGRISDRAYWSLQPRTTANLNCPSARDRCCSTAQPDDLGTIVSRVDYLQTSELDDSKLSICTQHKALEHNQFLMNYKPFCGWLS